MRMNMDVIVDELIQLLFFFLILTKVEKKITFGTISTYDW